MAPQEGARVPLRKSSSLSKIVSGLTQGSPLIINGVASESSGQRSAFYYMGNGKVQSTAGLILSLLEQLCTGSADLPQSLQPFYAGNPRHLKPGLDNAFLGASSLLSSSTERSAGEESKMEQSASKRKA